jgi:23S rRNA pseudouridine1911/1915/1917 synthase
MVAPDAASASNGLSAQVDADEDVLGEVPERRETVVSAALHGTRLDKALVAMAGEFSRNHLQTLIEQGHVRIDDAVASSASRKVLAGQRLGVDLVPTPESRAFRAEPLPLDIVFEDEHLMVIDKPAGLVVHPAAGHWSGTVLNGLLAHHANAATLPRAGIVHRLDKDTSGLMVVGKTLQAVTALVRAIAAREVQREYLALVHGRLIGSTFRVDAPIGRDPQSRVKMAIVGSGKPAQTDVTPLGQFDTGEVTISAVRCKLHTGRTHQIRVHLASRGHPLLADLVYGGRRIEGLERQALHAARLALAHPATGAPLEFRADLPGDIATVWIRVCPDQRQT